MLNSGENVCYSYIETFGELQTSRAYLVKNKMETFFALIFERVLISHIPYDYILINTTAYQNEKNGDISFVHKSSPRGNI